MCSVFSVTFFCYDGGFRYISYILIPNLGSPVVQDLSITSHISIASLLQVDAHMRGSVKVTVTGTSAESPDLQHPSNISPLPQTSPYSLPEGCGRWRKQWLWRQPRLCTATTTGAEEAAPFMAVAIPTEVQWILPHTRHDTSAPTPDPAASLRTLRGAARHRMAPVAALLPRPHALQVGR